MYTLAPVDNFANVNGTGQSINASSVRLVDGTKRAYGNDDSVYITVDTDTVSDDTHTAITKVNGTYTGVQDVDLLVTAGASTGLATNTSIFAVYDDDLYIIGAVVIGEDAYNTDNYAYAIKEASNEYIDDDEYTYWDFTAVVDGEIVTLTVKDKYGDVISAIAGRVGAANITKNGLFRLTYDADGYVVGAEYCNDTNLGGNKVYDNTDYGSGADVDPDIYSVYDVRHNATKANFYAVGRTLYVHNRTNDAGLTLAADAPIIVIQIEEYSDGRTALVYEEYTTISQALDALDNSTAYQGEVAAVRNDRGTAEYLVFKSWTNLDVTTDDGSTPSTGSVGSVTLNTSGDIGLADKKGNAINGDDLSWELYMRTDSQDDFNVAMDGKNIAAEWSGIKSFISSKSGYSFYLVVDGVKSNTVTIP